MRGGDPLNVQQLLQDDIRPPNNRRFIVEGWWGLLWVTMTCRLGIDMISCSKSRSRRDRGMVEGLGTWVLQTVPSIVGGSG